MKKNIFLLILVMICILAIFASTLKYKIWVWREDSQRSGSVQTKPISILHDNKWSFKIDNYSFEGACLNFDNFLIFGNNLIDKTNGNNYFNKSLTKRPGVISFYVLIFNNLGFDMSNNVWDISTGQKESFPQITMNDAVVYNDILYTLFYMDGRFQHDINAYNITEKKQLWSNNDLRETTYPTYLKYPVSIAVNDKYLYFANHESLYALDRQTGKLAWESKQLFEIRQGIMAGKKNVFVKIFKELSALDALTGKLVWKTKNTEKADGNLSLAYSNGVVFVKYNDFKKNGVLTAYDELTGAVLWESVNPEYFGLGEIVIADGVIHFCALKKVFGVDVATGKKLWEFVPEGEMNFTPFIEDGVLYFGTKSGYFYAIQ